MPEKPIPRLSPSIAHTLLSHSPAHAWLQHSLLGGQEREPTEAMERGKIIEALVMGSAKDVIYMVDAENYRTNAARQSRDDARAKGLIPVLQAWWKTYEEAGNAIKDELAGKGYRFGSECEKQKTVEWESNACPCKGILDVYVPGTIFDLKTCENAHPLKCQRSITDYGYDIQHAAYIEGIESKYPDMAGRVAFVFLFCEVEPPYACLVVRLAGSFVELGRRKWERAKGIWAKCLSSNQWPAYPEVRLEATAWQLAQEPEPEPAKEEAI